MEAVLTGQNGHHRRKQPEARLKPWGRPRPTGAHPAEHGRCRGPSHSCNVRVGRGLQEGYIYFIRPYLFRGTLIMYFLFGIASLQY